MRVKPAYWLWPLALWMALWRPEAQAGSWGGTAYQTADSIDATSIISDANKSYNYGASDWVRTKKTDDSAHFLIRMKNDPHHADSTQDSAKLHLWHIGGGEPSGVNDTCVIYFYVLKVDWGEGTGAGDAATSGQANYDSAKYAIADWHVDGALGSNDKESTKACSLIVTYHAVEDTTEYIVKIPGTSLTEAFFDYGLVAIPGTVVGDWYNLNFVSDNAPAGASTKRPYFQGWESGGAGGPSLPIGTVKLGTVKIGP